MSESDDMADQDDGSGFLRCFGRQMRLLRGREGLTRAQLGARLGYGDRIASVELDRRIPEPTLIDRAGEVLRAGGVLSAMKEEPYAADLSAHREVIVAARRMDHIDKIPRAPACWGNGTSTEWRVRYAWRQRRRRRRQHRGVCHSPGRVPRRSREGHRLRTGRRRTPRQGRRNRPPR
ncbi:helix-turn-helix transcriptional regulator [Streptomyces niveus]|uniref:helix-turn-helix domain-containing protein n=1 Tax=Streptomyces niveus TaxID=193462 RepID=UPI00342ED978